MLNNALLQNTGYKIGNGLFFDSVNDYVNTPFIINFTNNFTLNIRLNRTSGAGILCFGIGVNRMQVDLATGVYRILFENAGINTFNTATPTTGHVNITIVKNLNNWKVYNNGVLSADFNLAFNITTSILKIGSDSANTLFLNGSIYDLKIFNKALTPAEVTQLYNMQIPSTAKNNLIFNMPFESVNKVGSNIFTPELISGNKGQLIGYPAGSKCIVDINGNDIQTTPA
jgi:hypothetical protein